MEKEFNKKNMHQLTLNAIQTMKHTMTDMLLASVMSESSKVASHDLAFEVKLDVKKELDDLAINMKANINDEQKKEVINDLVAALKAKEFDLELCEGKDLGKIKISW